MAISPLRTQSILTCTVFVPHNNLFFEAKRNQIDGVHFFFFRFPFMSFTSLTGVLLFVSACLSPKIIRSLRAGTK